MTPTKEIEREDVEETKQRLPDGWRWVRLGDHVRRIGSGFTPFGGSATYRNSGVPLIRSQNVHMNRFENEGLAFISKEQDEEMDASRVQAGDVLLNITGASIGRVCAVPSDCCPANVNQHVCVIRSDGSLDAEFLAFYLATPDFQKFVFDSQAGATRQALTKGMIEEFQIPFAELAEQKRIAGILKEQMAAVERARRSAEAQLQAAEALPAAYLRAVFNSTEAEGWLPTRLSEVAFFQEGPGVRTHQFRNSGVKLLNVTNLVGGSLQLNNTNKYLEESEAYGRYKHFLVDENDIILASSGASWGKVAIARKQDLPLVMNTSTIRLRPSDERKLDRAFLQFFLESESFKEQIRLLITGAAQPNFGPMHLKQVEIRLPSAADQRRLAAQLSSQMASAERLHQTLAEQLDAIHRLPAALLREAFSGRL